MATGGPLLREVVMTRLLFPVLLLLLALPASGDRTPVRRGTEDSGTRRRGPDGDQRGRRTTEGAQPLSQEELRQKQTEKHINLLTPPRCGGKNTPRFRKALTDITNPNDRFNVEIWGNKQVFFEFDSIFYHLRSNRTAFVTMFWIGPEGSVFIPFSNLKLESNRDHKIDPRNIIVQPVGLERWRIVATLEPHAFPCQTTDAGFTEALKRIQSGNNWASGRWDVWSKVPKRRNRLRRRR